MALLGGTMHAPMKRHTFGCRSAASINTSARKSAARSSSKSLGTYKCWIEGGRAGGLKRQAGDVAETTASTTSQYNSCVL